MDIIQTREFWYFLIPVVIGIVIYYAGKSTKDEKELLLVLFKSNQILSLRIQERLKEYIDKYNAGSTFAFPDNNITFQTYLDTMTEQFNSNLSDEIFNNIKIAEMTKPRLESHIQSLSKQNEALIAIEIDTNLLFKKQKQFY